MWIIAKREMKAMVALPVGWIAFVGWLFLTASIWLLMLANYVLESQSLVADPLVQTQMTLTTYLLEPFFGNCAMLLLFVVPAFAMRTFAEERLSGADMVWRGSGVPQPTVVLGKWLAVFVATLKLLLGTIPLVASLALWSAPDWGALAASYIGLALLAALLSALGVWCSSVTRHQSVALVLSIASGLFLMFIQWLSTTPTDAAAQVAIMSHLTRFFRGVVRLSDVSYFVCFSVCALAATVARLRVAEWDG